MRWRWNLNKPKTLVLESSDRSKNRKTLDSWEKEARRRYPIQYFLQETLPEFFTFTIPWAIKKVYWAVRYKTINRYHILNISSKENNWLYGYSDVRERMLYAAFALLVSFVEVESDDVCWQWNDDVLRVKVEMDLLYNWWKYERPNRNWTVRDYGKFEEEDSNNLIRLIKIREYLWT